MGESRDGEMSVTNQVDTLIKAATSPVNLVSLFDLIVIRSLVLMICWATGTNVRWMGFMALDQVHEVCHRDNSNDPIFGPQAVPCRIESCVG